MVVGVAVACCEMIFRGEGAMLPVVPVTAHAPGPACGQRLNIAGSNMYYTPPPLSAAFFHYHNAYFFPLCLLLTEHLICGRVASRAAISSFVACAFVAQGVEGFATRAHCIPAGLPSAALRWWTVGFEGHAPFDYYIAYLV